MSIPATGPLRVCPRNPRYFADGSGRAVYVTGSHTWNNLQDQGPGDPPEAFDFAGYLDFLVERYHNFIRLWTGERFAYVEGGRPYHAAPMPWPRTGPGVALDGKPRFDLTRFDPVYFDRLRTRVKAARERGIYVGIMLFESCLPFSEPPPWEWGGHPFNVANNSTGVDGDPERTGRAWPAHTLRIPEVTRLQEAYVRHVIDTVNDLDNVLYEIGNETDARSTEWQYHLIRFIKEYEAGLPTQHPVGMTFQYPGGSNDLLFASPADWISTGALGPEVDVYAEDPPPGDGRKVILPDTDHLQGKYDRRVFVWKCLCRGLNPIYMDFASEGYEIWAGPQFAPHHPDPDRREPVRRALGHARRFAERVDLANTRPAGELASSGYCLANPGAEYLVYLPEGGKVTLDLRAAAGQLRGEWFDARAEKAAGTVEVEGSGKVELRAPCDGDAVLYVRGEGHRPLSADLADSRR